MGENLKNADNRVGKAHLHNKFKGRVGCTASQISIIEKI